MNPVSGKEAAAAQPADNFFRFTLSSAKEQAKLLIDLTDFARDHQLSPQMQYRLALVIDELITNCFHHGPCHQGQTEISVEVENRSHDLEISLCDSGIPFDPTKYNCPPCTDPGAMMPGGVGLCLVRKFAATMEYRRRQEQNILVLSLTKTL